MATKRTTPKVSGKATAAASKVALRAAPEPPAVDDRARIPSERPGQPGGRRDTNRKERTKALTDAALELFLAHGIEPVTIEDITTRADVAKGSFYRYFDDKVAVVEHLLAPLAAAVAESFDKSLAVVAAAASPAEVASSYEVLAEGLVTLILHHGDECLLYLQENRGQPSGARAPVIHVARLLSTRAIQHTAAVRAHGLLKPFPAELSTLTVIGAAERLLYAALSGQLSADTEAMELPGQLITLILDGIRDPSAKDLLGQVA